MMTKPTPLDVTSTFIPLFSGLLSIVGASAILYNVLSDRQRRFTSPYFRIMFGLSLADVIFGLVSLTSSFLDPKGSPGLFFARGNEASCKAVGFMKHFTGFIQPLYIASLSLYYLLVIKYDVSDDRFSRKVEPWLHVVAIGYPLLGSVVSVSLGVIQVTPSGCRIGTSAYRWIFTNSVVILSLGVIIACMLAIILHVRHRERIMNRRFSFGNAEISRSRNLVKQYKAVTSQACLYVGSFFFAWIFPGINSFLTFAGRPLPIMIVLAQIFWPLQGFFNSIIYFWPRYVKTKEEHGDKSFCWRLKDMIFTTTVAKEQRRVVRHAIRRRSSLVTARGSPQSSSTLHPIQIPSQNQTVVTFTHGDTVNEETCGSNICNLDSNMVGSTPQDSSIYYEPLFRLRQTTEDMKRFLEKEDGNGHVEDSIESAALQIQELYGKDNDSISSR